MPGTELLDPINRSVTEQALLFFPVGFQGRVLAGYRIVTFGYRWMPQRSVRPEFFALIIAWYESNFYSTRSNVAAMEAKPRVRVWPALL